MLTSPMPRWGVVALLTATVPCRAYLIEGYTDDVSYQAGDTISFYVSTDASTFDIEIYRDGWTPQLLDAVRGLVGHNYRDPWWTEDDQLWLGANWPASYTWVVPATWPTGTYLAKFIGANGASGIGPS